jgi:hypothetical protein
VSTPAQPINYCKLRCDAMAEVATEICDDALEHYDKHSYRFKDPVKISTDPHFKAITGLAIQLFRKNIQKHRDEFKPAALTKDGFPKPYDTFPAPKNLKRHISEYELSLREREVIDKTEECERLVFQIAMKHAVEIEKAKTKIEGVKEVDA